MGSLFCKCGYVFDLTPAPETYMWVAISDHNLEPFLSVEQESERLSKNYESNQKRITELDQLASEMKTLIYNCPKCNRIIWYRGDVGEFEVFKPES